MDIAACIIDIRNRAVPDGQIQCDHGVAARCVGEGDGRDVGARGVGDAVYPGEGVAGVNSDGGGSGLVDGEVEYGDTVAVGDRRCRSMREGGVSGGHDMESEGVEGLAGAEGAGEVHRVGRSDMQVHRQDAVRARRGHQRHRAIACSGEFHTVPHYWQSVLANRAVHVYSDIVIDIEYESNRTVTPLNIWNHDCVCPRLRERSINKRVRQIIFIDRLCNSTGSRHQDSEAYICHRIASSSQ